MTSLQGKARFIAQKRYFLLFGLLFSVLFFGLFLFFRDRVSMGISSVYRYYALYGLYVPIAVGLLAILKSYMLLFLTYIIHLRQTFVKVILYLLIYGFWLTLAIQLEYFEPRYTDIAILLIDAYALPLLIASSATIVCVGVFSFFHSKKS